MAHLTIKNIGPIKNVDFELNKINIIMGPQSSGKSTVDKIACYCSWVEKKISLMQSFDFFEKNDHFLKNLLVFHKLDGYLREGSEIHYSSSVVKFSYLYGDEKPHFQWVNQYDYVRTKISYIPAERNIVSMISDWKQVNLPDNNIRNFMSDWNTARKNYTPDNHSQIKYLDIDYFYNNEADTDHIQSPNGHTIKLMNASSGQQSMIPLYVLIGYFTDLIYNTTKEQSIIDGEIGDTLADLLTLKAVADVAEANHDVISSQEESKYMRSFINDENPEKLKLTAKGEQFIDVLSKYNNQYLSTNYSSLFIEEPELNLFPATQCELLYHIIRSIQSPERDHRLFLTTHSPYVLYALNNCMLGWLVKDRMPAGDAEKLACHSAWLNPALVSVWEIKDGEFRGIEGCVNKTIQGEDGLVSNNYFDKIMKDVMNDFYKMLNYYGDDQDED